MFALDENTIRACVAIFAAVCFLISILVVGATEDYFGDDDDEDSDGN